MKSILLGLSIVIMLIVVCTLPVLADDTLVVYTTTSDGVLVYAWADTWDEGHDAAEATAISDGSTVWAEVEYDGFGERYEFARGCLFFDTSGLPDNATITGASLYMRRAQGLSLTEVIYIVEGMPTYPHDPLTEADYNYTNYGSFGSDYGYGVVDWATDEWGIINTSNADALASIINLTGYTNLCIVEAHDYEDDPFLVNGTRGVSFYSYADGVGKIPYLEITYTTPAVANTVLRVGLPIAVVIGIAIVAFGIFAGNFMMVFVGIVIGIAGYMFVQAILATL